MKTMTAVLKYHRRILDATENQKSILVSSIRVAPGEQESFDHALNDLVIDGMVRYTELNPELKIKRMA